MKKITIALTLMLCMILLAACGSSKKEVTASPKDLAKQLAQETVTSDALSEVSSDILSSTYFVDMEQVEEASAYLNSGASACEATVIKCKDSAYVKEVETLLKNRVDSQTELYSSYDPEETSKLKAAIVKTSGNYAVLVVCDDTDKAEEILKNAGF